MSPLLRKSTLSLKKALASRNLPALEVMKFKVLGRVMDVGLVLDIFGVFLKLEDKSGLRQIQGLRV